MSEKFTITEEKKKTFSNYEVNIIYGKEKLKDILDNLLERLFAKELEKDNS